MKLKLLFLLLLASLSSYSQYTLIPDINFEKELIKQGIDNDGQNGKVLTSRINTVTNLDVYAVNISDLTGIQGFTSLLKLDCTSNSLTNLDLSKNTKLEFLNCGNNNLTNLNLSNLPNLEYVRCYNNVLTSLDVSNNPYLVGLECDRNKLISLNLKSNFTNFKLIFFNCVENPTLNCIQVDNVAYYNEVWIENKDETTVYSSSCGPSYTSIPDINFEKKLILLGIDTDGENGKVLTSRIMNLNTLDVSNNLITDLTGIENFYSLTTLNVANNQLTLLDVSSLKKIKVLDCSNNLLKVLNLDENSLLENLNFSNNQLSSINLYNNPLIITLKGGFNSLASLNINGLRELKTIEINNNNLVNLDVSKNILLSMLKCNNNLIKILDVSQNNILNSLFCGNNQLLKLDISKNLALNEITCENNLLYLLNLKNGNNNFFTNYDFRNNSNLQCIEVDNASYSILNWSSKKDSTSTFNLYCELFTLIPDPKFEDKLIALGIDIDGKNGKTLTTRIINISSLDVSNNTISNLTGIEDFTNLKDLNVSTNQLTILDVSKNTFLISLICYRNQLTSIDISQNKLLTRIDCGANKLLNLNLKNGNNKLFNRDLISFVNNPDLRCILVDDHLYSDDYWWDHDKDKTASYSSDCSTYTLIPDTNFEKKLIELEIDSGAIDGKVLTTRVASVTSLDFPYYPINDFSGIESFIALKNLSCGQLDNLKSIDISKNIALTSIVLNNSQLTSLDLSENTALTKISIYNSQLSSLNLSKNTALTELAVNTSQLTNVDVSKNTALTKISIYKSLLTTLDVSNNTKLTTLGLEENQLTSLDVSKNTELVYLNCISNQLTSLDVSNNVVLNQLDCRTNKLTTLLFPNSTQLKSVICSENYLKNLNLSKNIYLNSLNCKNNLLTSLDISALSILRSLSCSSNKLTSLDLTNNYNLGWLYCSSNNLKSINFNHFAGPIELDVSFNQLTTLDLSSSRNLRLFYCNDNDLVSVNMKNNTYEGSFWDKYSFKNNPRLTCIQVYNVHTANNYWKNLIDPIASFSLNCPQVTIAVNSVFEEKLIALGIDKDGKNGSVLLSSVASVTTLDLSSSGITTLSGIEYFTSLETLICRGNSLTTINLSNNAALKYLDCSNNPLITLDVSQNILLQELYCDGVVTIINKSIAGKTTATAQLTVLDLSNNVFLTKLSCSNNQIISLDLSNNSLLTDVNCSNNSLQNLNINNGNNTNMVNVNFKNNSSLSCIKVDNDVYSYANWAEAKDTTTTYSKTDCTLGVGDFTFDKTVLYPNPVLEELHISNIILQKASVYDMLGKLVKSTSFNTSSNSNTIDLSNLKKGVYFIYLESDLKNIARKIIVE